MSKALGKVARMIRAANGVKQAQEPSRWDRFTGGVSQLGRDLQTMTGMGSGRPASSMRAGSQADVPGGLVPGIEAETAAQLEHERKYLTPEMLAQLGRPLTPEERLQREAQFSEPVQQDLGLEAAKKKQRAAEGALAMETPATLGKEMRLEQELQDAMAAQNIAGADLDRAEKERFRGIKGQEFGPGYEKDPMKTPAALAPGSEEYGAGLAETMKRLLSPQEGGTPRSVPASLATSRQADLDLLEAKGRATGAAATLADKERKALGPKARGVSRSNLPKPKPKAQDVPPGPRSQLSTSRPSPFAKSPKAKQDEEDAKWEKGGSALARAMEMIKGAHPQITSPVHFPMMTAPVPQQPNLLKQARAMRNDNEDTRLEDMFLAAAREENGEVGGLPDTIVKTAGSAMKGFSAEKVIAAVNGAGDLNAALSAYTSASGVNYPTDDSDSLPC